MERNGMESRHARETAQFAGANHDLLHRPLQEIPARLKRSVASARRQKQKESDSPSEYRAEPSVDRRRREKKTRDIVRDTRHVPGGVQSNVETERGEGNSAHARRREKRCLVTWSFISI